MAIQTAKYVTNYSFARVIDRTATTMLIKNCGPSMVYLGSYSGSSSDGGTDTVLPGIGYPLLPGESVSVAAGKAQLNAQAQDTSNDPSTVWVVFS